VGFALRVTDGDVIEVRPQIHLRSRRDEDSSELAEQQTRRWLQTGQLWALGEAIVATMA
jgi:hypothetical protein